MVSDTVARDIFHSLEALVTTLQEHLTRLTSEVASHKSIIAGLRVDAYAAREAQAEVEALHTEVERLAGEVERLKEVVEEGLQERRCAKLGEDGSRDMSAHERDQSTGPAQLGIDMTYVMAPISREEEMLRREEPLTVEDLEPELEQEYEQQDEDVEHPQEEEEPVYERGSW
ncbi:hypothetical protein K439DRAFT_1522766 [Ramaria rubella]|nr:hypothetical protein K439DRAFT_1522766 [Ramaria rubella]